MQTRVLGPSRSSRWLVRLFAALLAVAGAGAIPDRAPQALRVWTDGVAEVAGASRRPVVARRGRLHAFTRPADVPVRPDTVTIAAPAARPPGNAAWPTADTVGALLALKRARLI